MFNNSKKKKKKKRSDTIVIFLKKNECFFVPMQVSAHGCPCKCIILYVPQRVARLRPLSPNGTGLRKEYVFVLTPNRFVGTE